MIDAWKIGVRIVMASNAGMVLGGIGRELFGLGKSAEALTGKLNAVKLAAAGAMGAVAGGAGLAAVGKLVSAGSRLVHEQALFQAAIKDSGLTQQEIAQQTALATGQAFKTANAVLGSGVSENLKTLRELRTVFGGTQGATAAAARTATEEASRYLDVVTRAKIVMGSLLGKDKGDQAFDMAKALEIKGVSTDPAHFLALLNDMVKASVASGGKVLGSDFLQAFKYGRTATQGWSDRFVLEVLPTLIQELKSGGGGGGRSGPGNALMSAFQAVVGGTMSNKAAAEFVRLHMVAPRAVIHTTTGNVKGIKPGGIVGAADFQADPYDWVQRYLVPALAHAGIKSMDAIREEVAHLFANRTAQQIMTMFATQQARFEKDRELNKGAAGIDAYKGLLAHDPTLQMKAFREAWDNLMTALGAPLVDTAMKMLGSLTNALNGLAQWAAKHPDVVRGIVGLTAALSGLAAVGGTIMVGGALIAALSFLAGPIGLVALAGGIEALGAAFKKIPKWLIDMAAGAAVGAAAGSVVPGVGTLVGAGVGAIAGGVTGAIAGQIVRGNVPAVASGSTTAMPSSHGLPAIGSRAAPDHGLPRVLPNHMLFGAMPPPPSSVPASRPSAVPPLPVNDDHPVPVHVTNQLSPRDIATGVTGHIVNKSRQPPGGYSGLDIRSDPWSAGLQAGVP